jgi:hypothetical protein
MRRENQVAMSQHSGSLVKLAAFVGNISPFGIMGLYYWPKIGARRNQSWQETG